MKKEITEYEEAKEVKKYIKCANCDKKWDERQPWKKGKQEMKILALNAEVRECRSYGGGYKTKRFGNSLWKYDTYYFHADVYEDYCYDCYDELFDPVSAAMEVVEEDYYVEETTRSEYLCDFCNGNMGDEADCQIVVNPYLEIKRGGASIARQTGITKEFPGFGNKFTPSSSSHTSSTVEESHDCCRGCAFDIFDTNGSHPPTARSSDNDKPGFWKRLLGF